MVADAQCSISKEDEASQRLLSQLALGGLRAEGEGAAVTGVASPRPRRACALAHTALAVCGLLALAATVAVTLSSQSLPRSFRSAPWLERSAAVLRGTQVKAEVPDCGGDLAPCESEEPPKLFCFCVTMTMGYEVGLIQAQYKANASVFGCDSWAVYSIDSFGLGGGVNTTAIPGPPAEWRPQEGSTSVYNTNVFLRAWDQIKEGKLFEGSDWVVKVDVDAVFFPQRLRKEVAKDEWSWVTKWHGAAFIKNCFKFDSMQGPLEVFSSEAVRKFFEGVDGCRGAIQIDNLGEDQFMHQCLKQLGIQGVSAFGILSDFYCDGMPEACDCAGTSHNSIVYHPCKSEESYFQCQESVDGHAAEGANTMPYLA